MHLPDGFLDPKVSGALAAVAIGVLGYSYKKVKQLVAVGTKKLAVIGGKTQTGQGSFDYFFKMSLVAVLVFAFQMLNIPLSSAFSGHLIGGLVAAIILGPCGGCLVISSVVVFQALLYGDGGIVTLGANLINMGAVAPFVGFFVYRLLKKKNEILAIGLGAWVSVVAAAVVCSFELGFSKVGFLVFPTVVYVHAFIGVIEAILSMGIVFLVKKLGWETW